MPGPYENILVERVDDVVTLTLNRPERLNVLTRAMIADVTDALVEIGSSDATGVVIAAAGRIFSAGHDFGEMAGADLVASRSLFHSCSVMMRTLREIPQPVVARVHGLATGAGCQLVAACDLAVASRSASFATPGGKGGLFCTTPLVAVGRLIGRRRALEMGMTGDAIDATTAADWGLVNRVVEDETLDESTRELLARATRGSVESKAIGKRAFYAQIDLPLSAAYDLASEVMASAVLIPDSQEAITAFLEKRPARWTRPA